MLENGRGLIKALEIWAKRATSGYKDVEVRDLSTSFRDGLAFCAIVHHYRPDLINFDSLSKENIYENNSLAFSVAEQQLGVPALLDAEDMVKYSHPDRLSIITYLSQLRNCFEHQNKVNRKPELKRIQSSSAGPPAKVSAVQPSLIVPGKRHEVCQVCQHRVFILERLIVDGKLYHTTCFRCHKCQALLNPGAYSVGDMPGFYECTVCLADEPPESNDDSSIEHTSEKYEEVVDHPSSPPVVCLPETDFRSKEESITFAKSNLWVEDSKSDSDLNSPSLQTSPSSESKDRSESSVSVKDKINVFEKNLTRPPKSPLPSPILSRPPIPRPRPSLLLSTNGRDLSEVTQEDEGAREKKEEEADALSQSDVTPSSVKSSELSSPPREVISKNLFPAKSGSESPKVSMKNSELSSPLSLRETNGNNLFPARSGSESPRISKDIFKSSLSPLKLNLPSSVRREPDTRKAFSMSPINSINSTMLPYSRGSLLLKPQPRADTKMGDSEIGSNAKLQSDTKLVRRSSLESRYEPNKGDKTSTETVPFSRTHSSQEIGGDHKAVPTTYTPVYKGLYGASNLTNSASKLTFRHSYVDPKSSFELENTEEKSNKIAESLVSEKDSRVDPESSSESKIMEESSDKPTELERKAKTAMTLPPLVVTVENSKTESSANGKEEEYPDDLNPFGEEEEEGKEYPDDLNPFGDDEEEVANSSKVEDYDESKNPFASDDEEDSSKISSNLMQTSESKTPHDSICSNVSSPSGSLKGTLKKRRAPKPPPRVGDIFPLKDSAADSGVESSFSSPSLSRKNFQTSSPKVRKSKPAPLPPLPPQDPAASAKKGKETDNMKLRMQQDRPVPKKKKRPAPSVPIHLRRNMKKIPLKEIMREMKEIEEKQREYERQGREIELLIRDRDKDEEPSVEEEEYIMQLFELVNQKNALFRRQAELMYIKRSQRLEEMQHQVEKEIRQLMEKPESEKTEEDRQKEEELTMELIDIVDQRNSIIDSIEMDRRRELEEDHSVKEQLEMKNGDLPITAEIKQKSGKVKKKAKKEKKKEEESGKGTLKKKKHLFSKRS